MRGIFFHAGTHDGKLNGPLAPVEGEGNNSVPLSPRGHTFAQRVGISF